MDAMLSSTQVQDVLNRTVWDERATVRQYQGARGFLERGEREVFAKVAPEVRGQAILDLGVGAGRTVPLLAPLASRYVGLDYSPTMVAACRQRFPDVEVQVGDARDLSRFEPATFKLVNFSYNGLDAIDHAGRTRVLREVHRVLKPGGLFWFSTLNIHGILRGMRPWQLEWPSRDVPPLRYATRSLRMLTRIPGRVRNRARLKRQFVSGDGWCIDTFSAHDYRLLVHYTSLGRELHELAEAGFEPDPLVLNTGGVPVAKDADGDLWFQILARK